MVNGGLLIAGSVGVLLTGAFLYWEIGRYAEPQVPRSLFDERKLLIGYTVGLFGGVALSIPLGLFFTSLLGGSLSFALVGLVLLVGGMELAQRLFLGTTYFGHGDAGAFYALAFRAGASAILILTVVSLYLGGPSLDPLGFASTLLLCGAILVLEVAGALLALQLPAPRTGSTGGPLSSGLVTGVGFFLLGVGLIYGPWVTFVVALLVLAIGVRTYGRLRTPILSSVPPPKGPDEETPTTPSPFGRTDR
jgi:hypothetical protein